MPIGWQIRLAIRSAPSNRIYFEVFGNQFVFVSKQKHDRLVYGRCSFENESRFWDMRIDGVTDRQFYRVQAEDLEPYRREIAHYLDSIEQAGSVALGKSTNSNAEK